MGKMLIPALVATLLATTVAVAAEAAPPIDQPVRYTIKSGETLIGLATRYMLRPEDYRSVQTLNKVADPYKIPAGTVLLFPERLLRAEPIVGRVASFRGSVSVDGRSATLGMPIRQGARVQTGENAFVTIELPDRSNISLPSQSRIQVEQLRRILLTGALDRNFRLEAGRSTSSVTPGKATSPTFRVTTPLSVSAVRGTEFRVALDPGGQRAATEVVGGTVGVAGARGGDEISVPRGFGIFATPAGVGKPVALLPWPKLERIAREGTDGVVITIGAVEGATSYRTELANDLQFKQVFAEKVTAVPSVSFGGMLGIRFYVRLTAIAESGLEGRSRIYALDRSGRGIPQPSDDDISIYGRPDSTAVAPRSSIH